MQFVWFAAVLAFASAAQASDSAAFFEAVRNSDLPFLQTKLTKADLGIRDRRGATLLMHAAAFGNVETMRLLLEKGADPNAVNQFNATALHWAARDPEKVRLLVNRGANVNVRSTQGRTPLMVACLRPGGSETVGLLLKRGADVSIRDNRGDTALGLAAGTGDQKTVQMLLARGADPNAPTVRGESALYLATRSRSEAVIRLLVKRGADVRLATTDAPKVKHGTLGFVGITPLHRAAAFGPPEAVRDLLQAGANRDAADGRGLTPLMFAVATDYPNLRTVELLLRAGADVNMRDKTGETVLDWAEKFRHPGVLTLLKKARAVSGVPYSRPVRPEPAGNPDAAIARSLALLQKTSTEFFAQSGCVGCHHQPLLVRAWKAARKAGIPVDEAAAAEHLKTMRAQWLSSQEEFLQSMNPGGGPNRLAENLLGLEAAGYKPDTMTDSAVVDLAEAQRPDGSWFANEEQPRPPLTESDIASTARAVRALRAYGPPARAREFDARIARARRWLNKAKITTTEDATLRLMGLVWAGAPRQELQKAMDPVLKLQRPDGGWAFNPWLESDAYSTGVALTALSESKTVAADDPRIRRATSFLLSTQYPDGSWYVRSRAIKFQPYFESGFPYGHDQWISVAATAWAVQGLASFTSQPVTARR